MMKLRSIPGDDPGTSADTGSAIMAPDSVRVLRVLGHGRAAQARLVEATFAGGHRVTCVEKVFAPGRLTRLIYRLAFQSPFAYQSNRDAILACFYRRRVAACALKLAGLRSADPELGSLDVDVAEPLYVRYDAEDDAWVLASQWIDGRGIRPAPANPDRVLRPVQRLFPARKRCPVPFPAERPVGCFAEKVPDTFSSTQEVAEIDELVAIMYRLEHVLNDCGLVGSGWQVAPRAMVSTANLLRTGDRYTIVDLESGIPAVLVPRYIIRSAALGMLPPFDDLDPAKLNRWFADHQRLAQFHLGPERAARLQQDISALVTHSQQWKESELALLRQPWRLLQVRRLAAYRAETFRRWAEVKSIDRRTADSLDQCPWLAAMLWWLGLMPSPLGRGLQRAVTQPSVRADLWKWVRDPVFRRRRFEAYRARCVERWQRDGRLAEVAPTTSAAVAMHRMLEGATPVHLHRWLTDRARRRTGYWQAVLLLLSRRYQSWSGQHRVKASIDKWRDAGRLSQQEAQRLSSELDGGQVRAYLRGFGMHVGLKLLAPVVIPAKIGGATAFLASGNPWFLLPMLATPLLRSMVTLANAWTTRQDRVPHTEALLVGFLPVVGSLAFPVQMFSRRPELSTFLIRDAAAKLARRVPVYGGADSRTEMAMIAMTDYLVAVMIVASRLLAVRRRGSHRGSVEHGASTTGAAKSPVSQGASITPRTRLGRWIDAKAVRCIMADSGDLLAEPEHDSITSSPAAQIDQQQSSRPCG